MKKGDKSNFLKAFTNKKSTKKSTPASKNDKLQSLSVSTDFLWDFYQRFTTDQVFENFYADNFNGLSNCQK